MAIEMPQPIGPYSPVREAGGFVFCSGQIGLDPVTGEMVKGGIEAEARQVIEHLRLWLDHAGVGLRGIVKTTIYLTDIKDFVKVNEIYGEYFSEPYPARATVQVAALPKGARVEIEAVALRR